MKVIVAIPVYNERKYVQTVLEKVRHHTSEVLFIDDGSTDGTVEFLQSQPGVHVHAHGSNQGYGQSVIDSFTWADAHGYDWVITMDCDEQHEPGMIPSFERAVASEQWDIISGSRYLKKFGSDDLPPGNRRAVNVAMTQLVNDTLGWELTDTFCGFKAHRVSAMLPLKLNETGYAFPMQLWPRAAANKLRITELPVPLIYNDPTRTFGGQLDDSKKRLAHYNEVFQRELSWQSEPDNCFCSE